MTRDDTEPLPPYAYIPGGPWPHPTRIPDGHLAGRPHEAPPPIADGRWHESAAYLRGAQLFNAGYYWEAHEAWEGLWLAHDRVGPTADVLRALIKLAAAGVKVREGQPRGVATHAGRAAQLFRATRAEVGPTWLGLDLDAWSARAERLAEAPGSAPPDRAPAVAVVFDFRVEPV